MKRALLTGGTGFVGSHLSETLAEQDWDLHLIVRPTSDPAPIRALHGRVTIHVHDGSTDGMIRILAETRPDIVYHLASLFISEHRPADIEPLVRSNLLFPLQLLEAMAGAGIDRIVNTGTAWQHFESRDYSPVNLYAATKQAFEALLQYYVEAVPLRAVTLELADTYGPRDRRKKLFHALRTAAASGRTLAMSPGEQLLDLVYIDDVVHAFVLAGERLLTSRAAGHETFSVSSGSPIRLRDVVERFSALTGRTLDIQWGGRPYRPREMMNSWSRQPALPGWAPGTSLEDGIRKTEGVEEG